MKDKAGIDRISRKCSWYMVARSLYGIRGEVQVIFSCRMMISFVSDPKAYPWQGYLFAVLLFVTALVQSFCLQQYFQLCFEVGMNLRTSLMSAIYKKVSWLLNWW